MKTGDRNRWGVVLGLLALIGVPVFLILGMVGGLFVFGEDIFFRIFSVALLSIIIVVTVHDLRKRKQKGKPASTVEKVLLGILIFTIFGWAVFSLLAPAREAAQGFFIGIFLLAIVASTFPVSILTLILPGMVKSRTKGGYKKTAAVSNMIIIALIVGQMIYWIWSGLHGQAPSATAIDGLFFLRFIIIISILILPLTFLFIFSSLFPPLFVLIATGVGLMWRSVINLGIPGGFPIIDMAVYFALGEAALLSIAAMIFSRGALQMDAIRAATGGVVAGAVSYFALFGAGIISSLPEVFKTISETPISSLALLLFAPLLLAFMLPVAAHIYSLLKEAIEVWRGPQQQTKKNPHQQGGKIKRQTK